MVTLAGQLEDVIARRQLRRALETCARRDPRRLVLDLARLESVDTPALDIVRPAAGRQDRPHQ